jgi:hypothetical protein
LAICWAAAATPLPWAIVNGIGGCPRRQIGCLVHQVKPPTAATDTITPVTKSFFMKCHSNFRFYAVSGANCSTTL